MKQNGCALRYVQNQNEDICLEAVKQDGLALKYIQNQTEDICLEAVKQNGYAIQYVKIYDLKEERKKMTIAEIENELGFKIEINE